MLSPLYLADADVDKRTDADLRSLLTQCFGDVFKDKRYCFEPPPHRWLVYDGATLAAHLALHEKVVSVEGAQEAFMGVAEVCVAPLYRGKGLVKTMLRAAEAFPTEVKFFVLLGNPEVYRSSGYHPVTNVYFPYRDKDAPNSDVLVKALRGDPWPDGKVIIDGPPF